MKTVGSRRCSTNVVETWRVRWTSPTSSGRRRKSLQPGEHCRGHGRQTLKSLGFRSMPPAPGDFSKSEHITAFTSTRLDFCSLLDQIREGSTDRHPVVPLLTHANTSYAGMQLDPQPPVSSVPLPGVQDHAMCKKILPLQHAQSSGLSVRGPRVSLISLVATRRRYLS